MAALASMISARGSISVFNAKRDWLARGELAADPESEGIAMLGWLRWFLARNGVALSVYMLGAVALWVIIMIVLPQLFMLDFSSGITGSRWIRPRWKADEDVYTFVNYHFLAYGSPNNQTHLMWLMSRFSSARLSRLCLSPSLIWRFAIPSPTTWPRWPSVRQGYWCSPIIPFWVNELLRAFAFRILFGEEGTINAMLMGLGILSQPIDFVREDVALYAGLGYAYILLMIFPIYNVVESLDKNQIEAARDMGASCSEFTAEE